MGKSKSFQFAYLQRATDEEAVEARRIEIAEIFPDRGYRWVLIAEVISRYAGENGLSQSQVMYLTDQTYEALAE
jgi:hypothetical protein